MKDILQQHIQNLYSKDMTVQGASFQELMNLTEQPVDWAYDIWNDLLALLYKGDNRARAIAAQLLRNLTKSDPDNRMVDDLPKLLQATKDEKFVPARHSLLALWKVGVVNKTLTDIIVDELSQRFQECSNEKNSTLIRYDISCVLRKIFDQTLDEQVFTTSIYLIETETDEEYLTVWKDL